MRTHAHFAQRVLPPQRETVASVRQRFVLRQRKTEVFWGKKVVFFLFFLIAGQNITAVCAQGLNY